MGGLVEEEDLLKKAEMAVLLYVTTAIDFET